MPLSPPTPTNQPSDFHGKEIIDLSDYQKGCFLPKCSHFKEWLKGKKLLENAFSKVGSASLMGMKRMY